MAEMIVVMFASLIRAFYALARGQGQNPALGRRDAHTAVGYDSISSGCWHTKCLAGTIHAIVHDPELLVLVAVLCDLLEIGGARKEEHDVAGNGCEGFI
jgi:hypothetical protein